MEIALAILATVLSIVFIHGLFFDGMLLAPLRCHYLRHLPLFFRKPLYECPPCMTSVWGLLMYGAASLYLGLGFIEFIAGLLPFLFSVGGLLILIRPLIAQAEDLYGEYFVLTQEREAIDTLKANIEEREQIIEERVVALNDWEGYLTRWCKDIEDRALKQPIGYKVRKPSVMKAKK